MLLYGEKFCEFFEARRRKIIIADFGNDRVQMFSLNSASSSATTVVFNEQNVSFIEESVEKTVDDRMIRDEILKLDF